MMPEKAKRNILSLTNLLLVAIMCIALFIRFYKLGDNPVGLFRDEASTGYDAYSMLKTGRDQYGTFLPLFSRSFGDYNESLYRFLVIPSVLCFGLTEFAVRFPAAVIGLLTVLIFYFLSRIWLGGGIALVPAFLLAVSPWHILYSRVGFRAILFPFLFCLGLYFFFKGLKKGKFLVYSALSFSFSLYSYSSARVFVPVFLVVLILIFFRDLKPFRRQSIIAGIILLFVLAALGSYWISSPGMARAREALQSNSAQWVTNYLSYFSPDYLFFNKNPGLKFYVLGIGQLYVVEIFTIIAGLIGIFITLLKKKDKTGKKHLLILTAGLLLYPIPAALTQSDHALRAIIGCIFFPLASGYGLRWVLDLVKKKSYKIFITAALVFTIAAGFFNYQKKFFHVYPHYSWYYWDYGWRQAITLTQKKDYTNIFVSNHFFLPHSFILFYTKYPPEKYQKIAIKNLSLKNLKISDFSLPPYHIVPLEKINAANYGNSLIITHPRQKKIIETRMPLKEVGAVKTPDGKHVLMILLEITDTAKNEGSFDFYPHIE
ncbi:MAG: glycosyltransferase family 39 protein [Candidatus Aminicenantes bacterium]|nr:glycosyltransferase family 39 protein [Candidatus Aminicenantes bacterium]